MNRCAVYARVSTDMQGDSLGNQVDYAREYIRRLGDMHTLDADCVYTDFDQSGYYTRFLQRPAIQKALCDAVAGKYDTIVFKEISRISRDQAEHIEIVSRFKQAGVRMIAINDNLDSDRPETLDLLGIHSVMAEMESKRISSRVSSGKKSLARRGVWMGEAPIGYSVNSDTRRLQVEPRFADIPRLIFHLYTVERLGTLKIAEYLNEHGKKTKNGRLWSRGTVNQVLRNPAYVGDFVYGKTRNTLKRIYDDKGYTKVQGRDALPEDEWIVIPDAHEALVSRETFATAQKLLSSRSRSNPRRSRHPLTGLLKCGHCGAPMVCQMQRYQGRSYRYYTCSYAFRYGRAQCAQPNINADECEGLLLQRLREMVSQAAGIEVSITCKPTSSSRHQEGELLKRERAKLETALERIYLDTELPKVIFERLKEQYLTTLHNIEAQLDDVESRHTSHPTYQFPMHSSAVNIFDKLTMPSFENPDYLRVYFHHLLKTVVIQNYDIIEVLLNYSFSS